jgi:hypothetical protein
MDERLKKALDLSNYMVTFNNQKRIIKEKYRESSIFYYNGSQFTLTKELITFVSLLVDKDNVNNVILTDDNEIPTEIAKLDDFLVEILDTYFNAVNAYYAEYQKLLKNRSTSKLAEYEEE